MTKRLLLFSTATIFVLFSIAAAMEQSSDADKSSTQSNLWTRILESAPAGIKAEDRLEKHATTPRQGEEGKALSPGGFPWATKPAGPLDFCPSTAACFDSPGNPCDLQGFPGGEVCEYQDPAITCPPPPGCPTYPFEVRSVHILLSNCDPVNACLVLVTPGIREVIDVTCPAPGNIICTGPTVEIVLPPGTFCQEYVIPLDPGCCVYGPYFACLNIRLVEQCNIAICHDQSCNPCCSYWDQVGGPFVDLCPGFPGNLAIWTDGLLSCQNNCPKPTPECSDGIDNDGDGLIDFPADCGCTDPSDPAEAPNPPTQCSDGVDNDGDGLVDLADPDCINVCDIEEGIPPGAEKNHYKTWRLAPQPFSATAQVRDQFMTDLLQLQQIEYLSNPVVKVVPGFPPFDIVDPDDHLLWYRAIGRDTLLRFNYVNQFESTSVEIDVVTHLLVPAQKDPHPPYDNLDHYKAYQIRNPQPFNRPVQLQDQFDLTPEQITSLMPVLFLTPAQKNAEPTYDMVTHYVAYRIDPPRGSNEVRAVRDQFGVRFVQVLNSELLLVPTRKIICTGTKGDINPSGTFSPSDVVCHLNCVFLAGANPPCVCDLCVADVNCDGGLSPADVVLELNRVFLGSIAPPWCGM